jgi:hypothetical protein
MINRDFDFKFQFASGWKEASPAPTCYKLVIDEGEKLILYDSDFKEYKMIEHRSNPKPNLEDNILQIPGIKGDNKNE